MKPQNELKMTFLSNSSNESFARAAVGVFLSQLDPTIDEINDIKTAVSEAVTNCIVHGYKNTIGKIYITVKIFPERYITVRIKDNGCGIPDIKKAREPMFTTAGDERAGLGFAVMETFMDKVKVSSIVGKYTSVILKKKLGERS